MDNLFWFTSTELEVIEGEDSETHPNRFGKSVASWIATALNERGFQTSVNPEDWGWRVDCLDDPCPIWIGCGNVDQVDDEGNFLDPDLNKIVWHCFVEADDPFLKKLFGKTESGPAKERVSVAISALLDAAGHIEQVPEP